MDTTPAVSPTPEPDLSNGKGITAKFVGLDATITSTNTGHSTSGLVCYTDGFQGPTLPGTPVSWTVQANSTLTVLFPIDAIAAALTWEEGQCDQTIKVQGDVFRGDACEGYNFAVAWPQDNEVTFTNPSDIWEELDPEYTEWSEWSKCGDFPPDDVTAADFKPGVCYGQQSRTRTKIIKEKSLCSEDTRVKSEETETQSEKCEIDCPCILEEPKITYGDPSEWGQCQPGHIPQTANLEFSCRDSHTCPPLPEENSYHEGNPHCEHFGASGPNSIEGPPWNLPPADFYIVKAGNEVKIKYSVDPYQSKITSSDGRRRDISHIDACSCKCQPRWLDQCQYRDIFEQICDRDPVQIGTEFVKHRKYDVNQCSN